MNDILQFIGNAAAMNPMIKLGIDIGIILVKIAVVLGITLLHVAYATYWERKVVGHMQVRLGPIEVGWHGFLQPIADGVKLFSRKTLSLRMQISRCSILRLSYLWSQLSRHCLCFRFSMTL